MKKFKLFALAAFAMLSTNAFAADVIHANTILRYTYDDTNIAAGATIVSFVTALPAADQQTLEIPATVMQTDNSTPINVVAIKANAFEGNTNIKTLTIADANVTTINDEAFKGCTALESVTIGKAVTTIGTTANKGVFNGCTKLATVTFNATTAVAQTIAAGAFDGTAITSLDLTPTKVETLNKLFQSVGAKVTEIKMPASLTSIAASAFSGLTKLNSLDFDACTQGITINANAFENTMALTSFTVPGQVVALKDNVFAGSYITALTIDATDADHALVVGDGAALGATKITSLTVNGANLTISAKAFEDAAPLTTVTFNAALAASKVAAGAFKKNGTTKITVNYTAATATSATNAFAQNAFAAAADDVYVTFKTSTAYGKALTAALVPDAKGNVIYGAALAYDLTIDVYKNGGSFAYAGFNVKAADFANGIKIAKKQGANNDINVMVYGAYFDNIEGKGNKSAIIMDQMHLIEGYYWIPAGTSFIVKSSSEEAVKIEGMTAAEAAANDSRNMKAIGGPADQNEIQVFDNTGGAWGTLVNGDYAINVINYYNNNIAANPSILYFLRDLKDGKAFGWKQREDDSVINYGQLFLAFEGTASARIDVIWADGSEEDATAIQTVKKANAEKGAIYNLAGQKVNAAYKGVVIKDGKKYIQK